MKRILLLALFFLSGFAPVFAQETESWSVDYSKSKSFIENKGQFDAFANASTGRIQYAVDFGFSRIFFGENGVNYSFRQVKKKSREEREAIMSAGAPSFAEHKQMERLVGKFMVRQDEVNMAWGTSSKAPKIIGIHPTSDYHGYSYTAADGSTAHVNHVQGFEKLIYTNVFPNIDVEYTVHPEIGVKYAFILHPGADPKDIEMIYDRDVVLEGGEIRIASLFGDIIDHAPISFYEENKDEQVASNYTLNGRKVSFNLAEYDSKRTLILDPWVQTPNDPNSNWDVVWELDKDAAGNVYVIAGIMPMRLLKYNSAGALQWTHNTPYDTTAWLGTMATDNLGNSYVTNGTDYKIQKIDAAGNLVWNNNNPSGGQISTEFWNISFNCDQTKLLIGGTGGNLDIHGRVYDVNMSNGNIISSVAITSPGDLFSIPPSIQEVRAMCPAPNGKYYFVTLDTVGYLNDNLSLCPGGSSSLFRTNSGIGWGYKSENFRYNNTGIKAIRADENFFYINRGNQLQKRSLVDASIVATATIPNGTFQSVFLGGNQSHNAGIDIDDCGNVYVGATTGVRKYDQNLNLLASYPTTFAVYDVRVSTGGDIIACGGTGNSSSSNRSGGIQSFAASACVPLSFACCDATICIPQSVCESDAPISLTTATGGGTWSGPGVNASGVFDPGIGAGTFTITYTLLCGSESISITVDPCASIDICQESNGSLTASNGNGTYTWFTGTVNPPTAITNEAQCIACATATPQYVGFPPFQFYTGCSVSTCPGDTTWTQYATGITTAPPSGYPIMVVDGNGTTIIISNVSQIVPCATNPCAGVTITVTASAQTNPSCFGGNNGSATAVASGGAPSYTYIWSPGSLNGATQNALSAGTYTVTAQDQNGCTGAGTITIGSPTQLVPSASSTPVSCNGGNNGSVTASATGGTPNYSYIWNPGALSGATQTGLSAATYTVTVTDGAGCTAAANVAITQPTALSISASNIIPATCGLADGGATVSAIGGTPSYSYVWSPAGSGTVSSNLAAGAYTVTVTDLNGCTSNVNFGIGTASGPTLSLTSSTDVSCNGDNDGAATVSASGGTPGYTYTWNPGGLNGASQTGLTANNYSVTVSDAGGCVAVLNVVISEPPALSISTSNITDATCGASDGSATVAAAGGTGSYSYVWSPSGSGTTSNNLASGAYTVTVTDQNNCSASVSFNIGNTGGPSASLQSSSDVSCNGAADGSATVSVSGGTIPYTYNWSPSGGNAATASGLSGGFYTVTITDGAGCISTVNVTINEPSALLLAETITDENCGQNDGAISVVASGGAGTYVYAWNPSAGNTPTLNGIGAGNYSLTVTDGDGCAITENYLVQSVGGIPVDASPEFSTIFSGESVQLFATGASSYVWTPATGLDCSNCANPLATPSITTTYIVVGTDANGCSGSDTVTIYVEEICGDLYVPTIFSPNGHGPTANEMLCIYGNCITELSYSVYNRWGELVFQTNSTDLCWDGNFRDKPAMSGVYAYKLFVRLNNGEVIEESGNVTLVR